MLRCPSILGELLLPPGRYYWETTVSRGTAYRLGVVTNRASRSSPLGENSLSWCLQCVPTVSGCVFIQFHTAQQQLGLIQASRATIQPAFLTYQVDVSLQLAMVKTVSAWVDRKPGLWSCGLVVLRTTIQPLV